MSCGHGLGEVPDCDAPATFHTLWLKSNNTSTMCDEHMAEVRRLAWRQPYESHAFCADCGMPGSRWHRPTAHDPESYCYWPSPDDASVLTGDKELVNVVAMPAGAAGDRGSE
jgi:hypothetical protein